MTKFKTIDKVVEAHRCEDGSWVVMPEEGVGKILHLSANDFVGMFKQSPEVVEQVITLNHLLPFPPECFGTPEVAAVLQAAEKAAAKDGQKVSILHLASALLSVKSREIRTMAASMLFADAVHVSKEIIGNALVTYEKATKTQSEDQVFPTQAPAR